MTRPSRRNRRRHLAAAALALGVVFVALPAWAQDDGSDPGGTVQPVPTTLPGTATTLPGTATTLPGTPTPTTPGGGAPTSSPATVSPSSVAAGESVTVSGTGFGVSQTISITFDAASATPSTAFSDASGGFTATVTVPGGTASGSHRITLTGRNAQGGQHQSVGTVSVTLAQTGAGRTVTMAIVGLVLVALGYRLVERVRWSPAVSTPDWRRPSRPRR